MSADTSTRKPVEYYRSEGKKALAEGEPVPEAARLGQTTEAVLNELELAAKDGTPELFQVPEQKNVFWQGVIKELAQDLYRAQGEALPPVQPAVDPVQQVKQIVVECEDERRRLGRAIEGNKSNRTRAQQLREHIFAHRPTPQSRPGWEAELKLSIAAIQGLGEKAPPAVRAMVPRLQRVERLLTEAPVIAPGKQRSTPPATRVQASAMALHLALGDLLSHAATSATDKRLASLTRIILPRKRAEEGEEQEEEKPMTPTPGAEAGAKPEEASP